MEKQIDKVNRVLDRARAKRAATEVIPVKEYYSDSTGIDLDREISRLTDLPVTEENIFRLQNLKRLRTKSRWTGKWFENTCREIYKSGEKKRQYILHTNPKFYWPWNPETVLVDTAFVDFYTDGSVKIKIFEGHPLLIDFAEANYREVTGRNTVKKLWRVLDSSDTETIRFGKLM